MHQSLHPWEKIHCGIAAALALSGVALWLIPGVHFLKYFCWELAAVLIAWIVLRRWAARSKRGKACFLLFRLALSGIALILLCSEAVILRYAGEAPLPADALIVLGAGVKNGQPSLALQTRLDRAAAYLAEYPDIPAVLTGGRSLGETTPEGDVMYAYLIAHYPDWADRLLIENRATSTAENYVYSRQLLESYGVDTDSAVIAVVTNGFHLYRARLLAQRLGLRAVGIRADGLPWWVNLDCYTREAFALVKTVLFDWEAVIPDRG